MDICTKCGKEIAGADLYRDPVDGARMHRACYFTSRSLASPVAAPSEPTIAAPATSGGSTAACATIGTLALAIGLWFLLNPSLAVETVGSYGLRETSNVVNLQRLAIGETLTIVGAIFLGFAMRPR